MQRKPGFGASTISKELPAWCQPESSIASPEAQVAVGCRAPDCSKSQRHNFQRSPGGMAQSGKYDQKADYLINYYTIKPQKPGTFFA
jgi:hypothetical protein